MEPTSTNIPMTTKNTGTRNWLIPAVSFSTRCPSSVVDRASPMEKAPIINANPASSAIPAARNAKASISTKPAPGYESD